MRRSVERTSVGEVGFFMGWPPLANRVDRLARIRTKRRHKEAMSAGSLLSCDALSLTRRWIAPKQNHRLPKRYPI